jgi:shikimate dehydrogenase
MLGAGGAARGALLPILEQRPAQLFVANRTVTKSKVLGEQFAKFGNLVAGGYPEIDERSFDLVINATSTSMRGELPPITKAAFAPGAVAYDLVYGRGLTPFLRLAREAGAGRLADGVGMLVEQAAEGFLWWRGVRPDTREMIEALTVPLG